MLKPLDIKDFNQNGLNISIDELSKGFELSKIDLDKKYERPPLAISIGFDDRDYNGVHYPLKFGSLGDFSIITGQKGSRKSFVKSMLEACAIGGKSNNYTGSLEIIGYIKDKYVISVDGEQSKYDVWLNGKRIEKMVGSKYDKYNIVSWREKSKEERKSYLEWIFMESPFRNELGLVMIDGYVDFIYDPNDQKECGIFWDLIMKYSTICNCHISGILHQNPKSDKMRGHMGTIGGQKAEMVMVVESQGEYSTVTCDKVRGGKPFKDFTIRIDKDWMPYISDDTQEQIL